MWRPFRRDLKEGVKAPLNRSSFPVDDGDLSHRVGNTTRFGWSLEIEIQCDRKFRAKSPNILSTLKKTELRELFMSQDGKHGLLF
jgi:hypothetical protein